MGSPEQHLDEALAFQRRLRARAGAILASLERAGEPWTLSADHRVVLANEAAAKLVGLPNAAAMIGRHVTEFVAAEDKPALEIRHHAMAQVQRTMMRSAVTLVRPDGTRVDVDVTSVPITFEERVLVASFSRDVTIERRTERALVESERQLREAQRIAQVGSWERDLVTNRLTWSEETFRIFEVDPATFEVSLATFRDRVHPEDRPLVVENSQRIVTSGERAEFAHRIVTPDGRIKHVVERCQTQLDDSGRALRLTGTVQDITARVEAEQRLASSEALFRTFFEQAAVGMVLAALDGRWLMVNDRFCSIVGYAANEILGMQWQRLTHPDDIVAGERATRALVDGTRDTWTQEKRYLHKEGRIVWVNLSLAARRENGQVAQILAVAEDITERKQHATAERLAARRIATQLEEKEVLLREVHHRVKNNLQIVTSLLSLQQQRARSPEVVELLRTSASRIAAMALVHERLYAAHDLSRVDVGAYVRDLATRLYTSFGLEPSRIALEVTGTFSLELDRAIVCGLLLNEVLSNSFKHAFPDGRTGTVRVVLAEQDADLTLSMTDDGCGFSPCTTAAEGTLGLRLLPKLAAQLEGSLERLPGPGTGFRLRISRGGA